MSLEQNSEILKTEIAESLTATNGLVQNYVSNISNSSINKSNAVADLLNDAVLITNKNEATNKLFKDIVSPNVAAIVNEIPVSANFDSVIEMFGRACIPYTNIRYSEFSYFVRNNDGVYEKNTVRKNAYLNNSAILGEYSSNFPYANNRVAKSKKIITTVSDLLNRGNILGDVDLLRSNLANKPYNADKNAYESIKITVMSQLSILFNNALNKIRTTLTCMFTDEETRDPATLVYHSENNQKTYPVDSRIYNSVTISSYNSIDDWHSFKTFKGWSTVQNAKTPDYIVGDILQLTSNRIDLYPVFESEMIILYRGSDARGYIDRSFSETTNSTCIQHIKLNTSGILKNPSLWTSTTSSDISFAGWTSNPNNNKAPEYSIGQSIRATEEKTIILNLVVKRTTIRTSPVVNFYTFRVVPNSGMTNGANLKSILDAERKQYSDVPSDDLIVGIRVHEKCYPTDPAIEGKTKVSIYNTSWFEDKTTKNQDRQSDAYGVAVWKSKNPLYNGFEINAIRNAAFSDLSLKPGLKVGSMITLNQSFTDFSVIRISWTTEKLKTCYVFQQMLAYINVNESSTITYTNLAPQQTSGSSKKKTTKRTTKKRK